MFDDNGIDPLKPMFPPRPMNVDKPGDIARYVNELFLYKKWLKASVEDRLSSADEAIKVLGLKKKKEVYEDCLDDIYLCRCVECRYIVGEIHRREIEWLDKGMI